VGNHTLRCQLPYLIGAILVPVDSIVGFDDAQWPSGVDESTDGAVNISLDNPAVILAKIRYMQHVNVLVFVLLRSSGFGARHEPCPHPDTGASVCQGRGQASPVIHGAGGNDLYRLSGEWRHFTLAFVDASWE
jgi:hypothetical protein